MLLMLLYFPLQPAPGNSFLAPEGLAPEGLAPEGLAPESLAPEGYRQKDIQLNEYETVLYFLQLSQNFTWDCLLTSVY